MSGYNNSKIYVLKNNINNVVYIGHILDSIKKSKRPRITLNDKKQIVRIRRIRRIRRISTYRIVFTNKKDYFQARNLLQSYLRC